MDQAIMMDGVIEYDPTMSLSQSAGWITTEPSNRRHCWHVQGNFGTCLFRGKGWHVVEAASALDVLQQLQSRNWNFPLDNSMFDSVETLSKFREWEAEHRVSEQRNVFLVLDDLPETENSLVQPPSGFNGIRRKSASWKELRRSVQQGNNLSIL